MKNKLLIFSVLLISLASCKKVIEIKETDLLAGDVALKTIANNEQGVIGAYSAMNVEMGILLNGVMSDELRVADFYNAATAHEWQYASTDIVLRDNFTAFPLYYRIIDRVNRVLQALPTAVTSVIVQTPQTIAADEAMKQRIRGEALFLRAFCHFELYRFYSNSTVSTDLALKYMETPSLETYARETVGTFMPKLKADIAEAKNLLPNNLTDVKRATKLAAVGLQARVALYMKEYADAITYSSEYISGLPLSPRSSFTGIWSDANNNEVAFKLARTTANRIGGLYRGISSAATSAGIGSITWRPSDKLWNMFDQANDIRFQAYFKDEPLIAARSSTKLIAKYQGTGYFTSNENVNDAKVFRTGEMYLIRAEARAEGNDLVGAAADLNTLRAARINGYTNVTFATKDAAINAIMDERFKELAFEGHRFWDLKRRNLPVTRLAADAPTTSGVTLAAGNFRFLLPIPNSEIQANPKIQQNPGYTN